MNFRILLFIFLVFSQGVDAALIELDLSTDANGNPIARNAVLSDQFHDFGILIRSGGAGISPISAGSRNSPSLFFSPDRFGASVIFDIVAPGTNIASTASLFRIVAAFMPRESVDLVTFDSEGNQVGFRRFNSPGTTNSTLSIGGEFSRVELRTRGNPGIAFRNIAFDLNTPVNVPAPSAILLFSIGTILLFGRSILARRRVKTPRPVFA